MTTNIFCQKLQKEAPALAQQPYPGAVGERIAREISAEGWDMWLGHQTMLINEYRLSMLEPKAREFLKAEMVKFLFEGGDGTLPPDFMPE